MNYSAELASVMQRMVLVSEIAALSRLPLRKDKRVEKDFAWREKQFSTLLADSEDDENAAEATSNDLELPDLDGFGVEAKNIEQSSAGEQQSLSAGVRSEYTESEKQLIIDLLERWEDPERVNQESVCPQIIRIRSHCRC